MNAQPAVIQLDAGRIVDAVIMVAPEDRCHATGIVAGIQAVGVVQSQHPAALESDVTGAGKAGICPGKGQSILSPAFGIAIGLVSDPIQHDGVALPTDGSAAEAQNIHTTSEVIVIGQPQFTSASLGESTRACYLPSYYQFCLQRGRQVGLINNVGRGGGRFIVNDVAAGITRQGESPVQIHARAGDGVRAGVDVVVAAACSIHCGSFGSDTVHGDVHRVVDVPVAEEIQTGAYIGAVAECGIGLVDQGGAAISDGNAIGHVGGTDASPCSERVWPGVLLDAQLAFLDQNAVERTGEFDLMENGSAIKAATAAKNGEVKPIACEGGLIAGEGTREHAAVGSFSIIGRQTER